MIEFTHRDKTEYRIYDFPWIDQTDTVPIVSSDGEVFAVYGENKKRAVARKDDSEYLGKLVKNCVPLDKIIYDGNASNGTRLETRYTYVNVYCRQFFTSTQQNGLWRKLRIVNKMAVVKCFGCDFPADKAAITRMTGKGKKAAKLTPRRIQHKDDDIFNSSINNLCIMDLDEYWENSDRNSWEICVWTYGGTEKIYHSITPLARDIGIPPSGLRAWLKGQVNGGRSSDYIYRYEVNRISSAMSDDDAKCIMYACEKREKERKQRLKSEK